MRIYGGTPEAKPYHTVFHVPRCCVLTRVVWIDTETAEYAEYGKPYHDHIIFKVKKIELLPARGLILIDPIPDEDVEIKELELANEH